MAIRIAINGYGRIGRNVLRAIYEMNRRDEFKVIAINSMSGIDINSLLTRFDTTHGKFPFDVQAEGDNIVVDGDLIRIVGDRDPRNLPWGELDIDLVMECTGKFTTKEKAMAHIEAGAKKVLVSAPAKNADATVVYGVNHNIIKASDTVVSNASCTTNCLAPIAKCLNDHIGIESGLMTTVHAFTNDQVLIDSSHDDPRRSRAATYSIIPTKTGAAAAVGIVIPELDGKLDGFAVRVPTINVSLVDLSFVASRDTSVDEIHQIMRTASTGEYKDIIAYNDEPLVSIDFNHHPASAIYEATETKVIGKLVKVLAWYDNEWGFSCRMLDTASAMF